MKKVFRSMFTLAIVLLTLLSFAGLVLAEDVQLNSPVEKVVIKKDKNGDTYARILIKDAKEMNGVSYNKDTSAMAFGDMVADAKKLKKGETLKCIASKRDFRGGTSYQVLKFLK